MSDYSIFTSESVSEGHPDKLADQISDAVLDAAIEQHPDARVACETLLKSDLVVVAGEISTSAAIDVEAIARQVIRDVGYTAESGIDPETCEVITKLDRQSSDIAQGVDKDDQGAGDQGMMFGYASNETDVYMPAPITYSHLLMRKQAQVRREYLDFIRPDAKCQLTFHYQNGMPIGVQTIVFSTQHDEDVGSDRLREAVIEEIIKPVLPRKWLQATEYKVNPTGRFVVGGPKGDCGLTGRKIIVDTYGGMAHHGGGAFSGKDPSKVDRSAAYAARYAAKNVVAAGIADRCEIQISYAIGEAEPTSIDVNSFGSTANGIDDEQIRNLVRKNFELRPSDLIRMLDLKRPIYRKTAAYGHFGHKDGSYSWEGTERVTQLKEQVNLD